MKYSIIIPAYNSEKTIGRALDSIASQGIKQDYEVIVVDDCSTDGTASVIRRYNERIPIKYMFNEKNSGPGASRQKALDYSSGEYIIFLDSDDEFNENAFDALNSLSTPIECLMVCSFSQYNKSNGKYVYIDNNDSMLHGVVFNAKFLIDNKIRFGELRTSEDLEFMCDCFHCINYKGMNIVYFPFCLIRRNSNDESITNIKYNGSGYIESHVDDYLMSTAYASMKVYDKYHDKREGKSLEVPLFLCRWSITSAFFQIQNAASEGDSADIAKNKECIKKCIESICSFFKIKSYSEFLDGINYDIYSKSSNKFFPGKIERISMYDFIDSCMRGLKKSSVWEGFFNHD